MAEQLGRIERPLVERFRGGRNLLLVPLVFGLPDTEGEGPEKLNAYWRQVEEQVSGFESKLGPVNHIYHELVTEAGEAGISLVEKLSQGSHGLAKARCESGASLEVTEDEEVLQEVMDLQRCLMLPLASEGVSGQLEQWFTDSRRKRYEYIARQIDETLLNAELGLLVISEGHQVQFPEGIEVFYVAPPGLDDLRRWIRDRLAQPRQEPADSSKST
jgi:hypothetical protein